MVNSSTSSNHRCQLSDNLGRSEFRSLLFSCTQAFFKAKYETERGRVADVQM